MSTTYYALKTKDRFELFCLSKTVEDLNKRESQAYGNWLGMQPKGSNKTMADFKVGHDRVKVVVEKLD